MGKIVMGTVAGNIHNFGKDIVTFMLGLDIDDSLLYNCTLGEDL